MKLCRFELLEDASRVRSGIFHDGRLYETDGKNPIGVHDLGKLRLLPPIGQPPSVRIFDHNGEHGPEYRYANPTSMIGPGGDFDAPPAHEPLDVEIQVGAIVRDPGERIDPEEAAEFILGFTIVLAFFSESESGRCSDFPLCAGPFLTTPDEISGDAETKVLGGVWRYTAAINSESTFGGAFDDEAFFGPALVAASKRIPLAMGDMLVGPPLPKPPMSKTPLGRSLLPGDSLVVTVEKLGALNVRIV